MFVIMGLPRSGTTLLAQCLNAHSEVVVPDETDFLVPAAWVTQQVDDPDAGRRLVADVICSTDAFGRTLGAYLSAADVRAAVAEAPYTLSDATQAVYRRVAEAAGVQVAGDKSPNDMHQVDLLIRSGLFTESITVIHLVRDPRDVITSMAKLGWLDGLDTRWARLWAGANRALHDHVSGEDRYLVVRYEDLVADPAQGFERLCEHIGVPFEPAMVSDRARFQQFPEHRGMPQHASTFRPIDASSVAGYGKLFSPEALLEVAAAAGEVLELYGYPVDLP